MEEEEGGVGEGWMGGGKKWECGGAGEGEGEVTRGGEVGSGLRQDRSKREGERSGGGG